MLSIFPGSSPQVGDTMKRKAPVKLTQAVVERLKIEDGKRDEIWFDKEMHGFGLRIRSDGKNVHRTFVAQYKIGSKHRRVTLGNVDRVGFDDAKKKAKEIFGRVAIGEDPAGDKIAARTEASSALGTIIEAYLEVAKERLRRRSYEASEHRLKRLWKPLHGLTVGTVSRAIIAARMATIAKENGPIAANRARAALSAMFRWAIGEGLCESNPVIGTNRQRENDPRERSLSDSEAARVFLACPDNDFGRCLRLLMLTGCRRDEIGNLQWSEIDFEGRTITLPAIRTKNNQAHVVPLSDSAIAILQAIPRRDRICVFGRGKAGFGGWSKCKRLLDDKVKLESTWTLHDLRRTVRTGLGMLGVAPHVAEAVLNHLPAKLIRTYDRNTYAAEKRAALELWANHLAVAVARASGANVTTLRQVAELEAS
jgi:integrase